MAKLFFFTAFLFLYYSSQAQKIRFTDTTNEWTYLNKYNSTAPGFSQVYKYTGDTMVNGRHYLALGNAVSTFLFVREDTLLQKVYCIKQYDTVEKVLYDYTASIGDSIGNWDGARVDLQGTDTVSVSGTACLLQRVGNTRVIAGIGALDEVFLPRNPHPDRFDNLVCFKNKGIVITVTHRDMGTLLATYTCLLSVDEAAASNASAVIIPNPVDMNSRLRFKAHISGELTITNAVGKIVATIQVRHKQEVLIGNGLQQSGVYYYCLRGIDGATITGKFTKVN